MKKEIKIIFDEHDVHLITDKMTPVEFMDAVGTAFLGGCEEFGIDPYELLRKLLEDGEEDE